MPFAKNVNPGIVIDAPLKHKTCELVASCKSKSFASTPDWAKVL